MIKALLLFTLAYWLVNGLVPRKPDDAETPVLLCHRVWFKPAAFVSAAVILAAVFGTGGGFMAAIAAAVFAGAAQLAVAVWLQPRMKDHLISYFILQAVQIAILYLVLFLFGQAGNPGWMLGQLKTLLFAKKLVVDEGLVVPAVLLLLVFVTLTSSELVGKILLKFGNPMAPHEREAAAALEPVMEGALLQKQQLKQGGLADMAVEEQIEVSNEADELNPVKTKQSIKVQYHWYNKEEESSKGKYIGILERLLICVFVYYEIYQGLVLIGAMKTLARFKLFDNKAFAEYYLIGTLLSLLISVVCGFLLRRLLLGATLS